MYLSLSVLGLHCYVGSSLVAMCRLLIAVTSHCRTRAPGGQAFGNCGLWATEPRLSSCAS